MARLYGTLIGDNGQERTKTSTRVLHAVAQTWAGSIAIVIETCDDTNKVEKLDASQYHVNIYVDYGSKAYPTKCIYSGTLAEWLTALALKLLT